jgi:hypothetical protein
MFVARNDWVYVLKDVMCELHMRREVIIWCGKALHYLARSENLSRVGIGIRSLVAEGIEWNGFVGSSGEMNGV